MTIIIIIIAIAIAITVNYLLASDASSIVADKTGNRSDASKWFHMCFWLGPVAYILVAAMPDSKMRESTERTAALLERVIKNQELTQKTE